MLAAALRLEPRSRVCFSKNPLRPGRPCPGSPGTLSRLIYSRGSFCSRPYTISPMYRPNLSRSYVRSRAQQQPLVLEPGCVKEARPTCRVCIVWLACVGSFDAHLCIGPVVVPVVMVAPPVRERVAGGCCKSSQMWLASRVLAASARVVPTALVCGLGRRGCNDGRRCAGVAHNAELRHRRHVAATRRARNLVRLAPWFELLQLLRWRLQPTPHAGAGCPNALCARAKRTAKVQRSAGHKCEDNDRASCAKGRAPTGAAHNHRGRELRGAFGSATALRLLMLCIRPGPTLCCRRYTRR